MGRLLVVANRLPVTVRKWSDELSFSSSPGGLATGLSALSKSHQQVWIGWPGLVSEKLDTKDRTKITEMLTEQSCHPVFLSAKQVENYYQGFANKTIWPLFHYFPLHTVYENRFWRTYRQVNELFCSEVAKIAKPGDCIWIHDYHLMLLPQLIRQEIPEVEVGFFLHIPFPSFELFRLLPWREEILTGLLGADVVGFHTYDYVRHFLSSACRIVGVEHTLGELTIGNRVIKVDAFPMGIDYEKYSQAPTRAPVRQEVKRIRQKIGDCKIVASIDRLDYTKGIIQRLEAFDLFLSENSQYKGKVTLIMVAVPSRTRVGNYVALRKQLEQLVGRVNGEHGTLGWLPVWYLYRSLPFEKLTALYHVADVALVTPLRDGMNLIAKEFLAAKTDGTGVLVLSEMTGAASELGEALIVNANNKAAIVAAIKEALEMPRDEQIQRNRLMQSRISRYNVSRWALDFLNALADVAQTQQQLSVRRLSESARRELITQYKKSRKRLLFLDYDGTIVSFRDRPEKAGPDDEILELLRALAEDPHNSLVVISGRDKTTLNSWLAHLNITLIAEHGAWIREEDKDWHCVEPSHYDWKEAIRPILELYADRTPRSLVEEKDFSLVWHFRRADPELAYVRGQELRDHLMDLAANLDVGVFEGSKIIEVRHLGINKGRAAELWLAKQIWDFIIAAGDDYTDEEMFAVLPQKAYSINVGPSISKARFNIDSVSEMRLLLRELTGE
ncbi:MAG: bifunctional alpha,alpha-trehalose-phosphate synthase (UDP-forming)/trehalose-phosphatase [Planctomycetota bacterium]|jgi:trehalose 6-phosphate synthase/phosphatase